MRIVTIDFETYYDQDYSLSKLTTEQYIRSPLFEIIGMGIKEDSQPARWVDSADVRAELDRISWGNCAILAHNTFFDGAILSWHFGIKPKLWLDTLSMSKPFHMVETGGSLASLAIHYGLGEKGSEVKEARGKHRVDFDFASLVRYSQYCLNDVELTFKLYQVLAAKMPAAEVAIIHQNICMFVNPALELDARGLQQHMEILQTKQADLVRECGVPVDVLRSNDKFANFLQSEGVAPPQAISSKTKVLTWAFNKSQPEFVKLMEHPNARVAKAVAARLGVRSTIEFTRAQSLLGVSARGRLPVMLNYYGAHTGRDSGGDRLNLQNLPRNGTLRRCIRAPRGYKLLAADLSQIEARITAWLAGETNLLADFAEQDLNPNATEDVYTKFASKIYGRTITKADKTERFVGKTCVAAGTLVLCDTGWKAIETVTTSDKVWDGDSWVCHKGLVFNGWKKTLPICGAWLTPDHLVWSGEKWIQAEELYGDASILYQALATAADSLPSQVIYAQSVEDLKPSLLNAIAGFLNTLLISIILETLKRNAATYVLKKQPTKNTFGNISTQCQKLNIELGYSIGLLRQLLDAIQKLVGTTFTTGNVAYPFVANGVGTAQRFLNMQSLSPVGMIHQPKWTEWTITKDMNPATYGSQVEVLTYKTNGESRTLKQKLPVYDLLSTGPNNRFTILTNKGPLLVHNCILGLGYGMSGSKLSLTLSNAPGVNLQVDRRDADGYVSTYRREFGRIPQLWDGMGKILTVAEKKQEGYINLNGEFDISTADGEIKLPNGLAIRYPGLIKTKKFGWGGEEFFYARSGAALNKYIADVLIKGMAEAANSCREYMTHLHGAAAVENLVQALANIILKRAGLFVAQKYPLVLRVHDEVVALIPEEDELTAVEFARSCMTKRVSWAPTLPINCEIGVADNYGDC